MKGDFVLELYKKQQTVFTLKELSLLFSDFSYQSLKNKIHYAIRVGKLLSPRKGIYTKENFNFWEAANKIYSPSYISLETVLQQAGIIFQEYRSIFVVSYLTRKINIGHQEIYYRKLKDSLLLNKTGIVEKNGYFIASSERAFLDTVYLYKDYHFDNLEPLRWEGVFKTAEIYESELLKKRVQEYYEIYKKEYA